MENNTAKHTVLQLGALITLYVSISFLVVLLFSIINLRFEDAAESYWQIESSTSSLRVAIAMLLVFFPTYLALTRQVNKNRRTETNSAYLGLTKWLLYLSLLVGGGVLLGDAVAVILSFLEGELTTRFVLKAAVLMLIVGAAFYYYLQDARGYWLTREKESKLYGLAMAVVVTAAIVMGFFNSQTPNTIREMKLDETQISDLQQIQWKIEEALAVSSSTVPASLEEAYDGFPIPEAPEDRAAYSYEVTEQGFNLCATFSRDSNTEQEMWGPTFDKTALIRNGNSWQYKEGRYCFERIVN
ncbi:hypothetical protein A3I99_04760 [Candidatus Kaiserbacteria bacterium RIFCSPLOWO2_02_FULL_45_11b]|uniref:DUF5671 domain-containing protein n=1 Tax=Candidatus Kaiserbacteria bacterium RIFCSPLOWO2_12_FULL_45_26 TaxID=1798525 RepID=A0A1F6FGU2_9BACT|nr:MAG: hypothetical protein A2929_00445 [Candidatus Kaiserbacteria bacterium RIFCSPLOWO2_01_FULL_45_25]OGG81488.1 MAG: hypothetical protein A3I99_04760 [Candidatus Kaiserbacteria bacterium RIFCSPLOWO2_02_FULL_45_11b]OGG85077.1 MAG: hypothetical protein A3G90_03385 [Candidatus Kaiserbacteria bacterium RIFCSPLOWO2_12_FULL_45_26]